MHTEHLQNVRLTILVPGWFVAVAVTSLVVLIFEAIGAATTGGPGAVVTFVAVAVGFAAGGFFTGFVARRAPILHGAGMGITSIVVWALANALAAVVGREGWSGLDAPGAIGIVLAQMAAAMLGALVGYNLAVRGKPGLSEELPIE